MNNRLPYPFTLLNKNILPPRWLHSVLWILPLLIAACTRLTNTRGLEEVTVTPTIAPTPQIECHAPSLESPPKDLPAATAEFETCLAALPEITANQSEQLGILYAAFAPEQALDPLAHASKTDAAAAQRLQPLQLAIQSARFEDNPAYTLLASGRALAAAGYWQLARYAFERVTHLQPNYAEGWAFWGHALQQTGSENAYAALQTALQLDPNALSAHLFIAAYWQQNHKPALALMHLLDAQRLDPQNPQIQIEIARAYAGQNLFTEAQNRFAAASQQFPDNPQIWQAWAQLNIDYNLDLRNIGLPAARQAVLLAPKDPAALDTIGQIYLALQNPLLARRFFLQALEHNPQYAQAHLHLGYLYLLQNDPRAVQHLQQAQTLAPNTRTAFQAARLLQYGPEP